MTDFTEFGLIKRLTAAVRRASKFIRRRSNEQAFAVFTKESLASGGTTNLQLKNPTDSTTIDVSRFLIASQFEGEYTIFDSFSSAPSGGTTESIDNLKMDAAGGTPDSGNMVANSDVSFTADGTHFSAVIPSGGAGANTVGGQSEGTEPLIEPGREIVIQLQNDSAETVKGSIGIVYTETPQENA